MGGGGAKRKGQRQRSVEGHCRQGKQQVPGRRRGRGRKQGGEEAGVGVAGHRGGLSLEGGGATECVRQAMAGRG